MRLPYRWEVPTKISSTTGVHRGALASSNQIYIININFDLAQDHEKFQLLGPAAQRQRRPSLGSRKVRTVFTLTVVSETISTIPLVVLCGTKSTSTLQYLVVIQRWNRRP